MTKTNDDIHVNKKYKDTVFRKLFGENKENADKNTKSNMNTITTDKKEAK